MADENTDELPTEEDFLGLNGAYAQSIAIMHKGLNDMGRKLDGIKMEAGSGTEVQGHFPSYVVSANPSSIDRRTQLSKQNYELQLKFGISGIRFVKGKVLGYNSLGANAYYYPTIGGVAINASPPPHLPVIAAGAICYFKHTFTWNGNYTVTTDTIEIVQFAYGIKPPNVKQVSSGLTTPVSGNIAYVMFAAYNENKAVTAHMLGEAYVGFIDSASTQQAGSSGANMSAPSAAAGA